MFGILGKSFSTGIVTTSYPAAPPEISAHARGRPEIDWANWKDASTAAAACPTGAIEYRDDSATRIVTLDLGKCVYCGLCAEADKAIRMTGLCQCAARGRHELVSTSRYQLNNDGTHHRLLDGPRVPPFPRSPVPPRADSVESLGRQ